MCVAFFVAATIFCGCSKDDDGNFSVSDIVGSWKLVRNAGYEANADGSDKSSFDEDYRDDNVVCCFYQDGTGELLQDGEPSDGGEFNYSVNGNVLRMEGDDYVSKYKIEKLTSKELVLYYYDKTDDYIESYHEYYERK